MEETLPEKENAADEQNLEEQQDEIRGALYEPEKTEDDHNRSIFRHNKAGSSEVPLWLITFTDVMALMLTFFVLLYAMSKPAEDGWDEVTQSLGSHFSKEYSMPYKKGSQDVVSIDKIPQSRALDLGYIEGLINRLLEKKDIGNVMIFQNEGRLIISLPSKLLFDSGSADVKLSGKKALFPLAGVLSRIKNRLEIIGHTDPAPVTSERARYNTNWRLSLARSANVASVLKELGYTRTITVRGLSSGRYEELPDDISVKQRYELSRRVDIVVMRDEGYRIGGQGFN